MKAKNVSLRQLDLLSLMISSVALTLLFIFVFLPWLNVDSNMTGLDIIAADVTTSGRSILPHMEDAVIPNGIVITLPLVQASILFQYTRRMFDTERPRRRATTVGALVVGIIVTVMWVWTYTVETTDLFNLQDPDIVFDNVTNENDSLPVPQQGYGDYTTSDVLGEQFTTEFWLYLMLSLSLFVLPWLDQRPEAPSPGL